MAQEKNLFKLIPKVDEVLEKDRIIELLNSMPRKIVVDSIREEIEILREDIKKGSINEEEVKERNRQLVELIDRAHRKNSISLGE